MTCYQLSSAIHSLLKAKYYSLIPKRYIAMPKCNITMLNYYIYNKVNPVDNLSMESRGIQQHTYSIINDSIPLHKQ